MAGTWALNLFDRLHLGHHILLDRLSEMSEPVACVTSGELVGRGLELGHIVQPPYHRLQKLREYLEEADLADSIETRILSTYEELTAIVGPTHFMMYIGPCCNEIEMHGLEDRRSLGMNDSIEYLKPVRAQDGEKLSSARIRRGEIDRLGRALRGTREPPRRLEKGHRYRLQTPKGEVFTTGDGPPEDRVVRRLEEERPPVVITVGDVTSATIAATGFIPDVRVVDGITKRGRYDEMFSGEIEYTVYNPASVLYPEAWSVMDTAIHDGRHSLIVVDGEEDLLGFPAVLLAPEGSVMLYGQPNVGIVWVPVDRENKHRAKEFLEHMPIITG